jgi:spore coat polysaccharide biosynthesis protein SpsF
MKSVAIIQARMGSTRLPGKVLSDLEGEPMLARVVNRSRRAITVNEVVVATTIKPADKPIAELCSKLGRPCFQGDEDDVLDRYYRAALAHRADLIIRITADCPMVEPEIIDRVVLELQNNEKIDYAGNTLPPRTFPRGLDVEAVTFEALERAWREDENKAWREHVTPYIYNHPEKFKLYAVVNSVDYSSMRWTVDTYEDLSFIRNIYKHFGHDHFSWHDVLTVLRQHPEWLEINRHVKQKII